jgi:iron(III) transport system substrate-binding protein
VSVPRRRTKIEEMIMSKSLSRRAALVGTALLGATPALADLGALEEGARKEGGVTWYTAQTDGETAELIGRRFTERYPGVRVTVVRTTAQVAYERLSAELKNKTLACDVFSSTDPGHDESLKQRGLLDHYVPRNDAALSPAFRAFDKDGYYHSTSGGLILIAINTGKIRPEDAPKNWPDLLLPRWNRQIALGHPAFSGFVGTWVLAMRKLYGWSFFEGLEKNHPQVGRSIIDTTTMLTAGERSVGASSSTSTLHAVDKGNPLAVIYPTDGTLLIVSASAILANAPHPNAARLFLEFLQSEEVARISVQQRAESLRPDVVSLPGAKPFTDIKTFQLSVAETLKGIPEVIEQWRDTFGG